MVFFILVLVKCIDYSGLSKIDNNSNSYLWDYIDLKKIVSDSFLDICFIIIFLEFSQKNDGKTRTVVVMVEQLAKKSPNTKFFNIIILQYQ